MKSKRLWALWLTVRLNGLNPKLMPIKGLMKLTVTNKVNLEKKVDDGLSNLESNLLKAIAASKPPVAPPGSLALQVTRLVQVLLSQSRMLLLL